jgi:hypothetical protein
MSDEFPNTKIVVRPHPSEDHAFYRTVLRELPNVEVNHEGSVIPWLLATRALIHDGCTTGIEAALAGVPTVVFKSISEPALNLYLPNVVGRKCTTEDAVMDALRDVLAGNFKGEDAPLSGVRPEDRRLLANFDGETFDRLLSVMDEATTSRPNQVARVSKIAARETVAMGLQVMKSAARLVVRRGRRESAYSRTKFYGYQRAQVRNRIANAERVTGRGLKVELETDALLVLRAR